MPLDYEEYNKVGVVTLGGDLTGDDAVRLCRTVDERVDAGRVVDFVIDCTAARAVDGQGLEALLWARRRTEAAQGRVRLAGADDVFRKILEITRLDHRFECHPDLAAALKSVA